MGATTLYESRLILTVLSDRPIDDLEVGHVMEECDTGDMVLASVAVEGREVTRAEMDELLVDAGSDPSFWVEDD